MIKEMGQYHRFTISPDSISASVFD